MPDLTRTAVALPGSLGAGEYLVTADAAGGGDGSLATPWTLAEGLAGIASGQTLLFGDGIYTVSDDTLTFGVVGAADQVIYKAVTNARPVIRHSDARTIQPTLRAKTTLDGLWLGADIKDVVDHTLTGGDDVIVQNCTLWNFYQAINVAAAKRFQSLNNRIINCGTGTLFHDIYINDAAAGVGNGAVVRGNIHIGGEAYKIHLWHTPDHATIDNNFAAGDSNSIVIDGDSHTVTKNIVWGLPWCWFNSPTNSTLSENLYGYLNVGYTGAAGAGSTADANAFFAGIPTGGTNPVTWTEAEFLTNLGHSRAEVNLMKNYIKAAFAQTVDQIWADNAIEPCFTVLSDLLANWNAI